MIRQSANQLQKLTWEFKTLHMLIQVFQPGLSILFEFGPISLADGVLVYSLLTSHFCTGSQWKRFHLCLGHRKWWPKRHCAADGYVSNIHTISIDQRDASIPKVYPLISWNHVHLRTLDLLYSYRVIVESSIYVWASENGGEIGDCSADGYVSNIHTIWIGANRGYLHISQNHVCLL